MSALDIIHNVLYTPVFVEDADMSVNQTSDPIPVQGITCYAIQSAWTDFSLDTTARITTYASNNGIDWSIIDNITPNGENSNYMLNVEKAGYRFVQVTYTQTTGSGTLNTTISGKII